MQYIIRGSKKLKGEISVSGNKNSILPCMAAALLTDEDVILENTPEIIDVETYIKIFKSLNVQVKKNGNKISINASNLNKIILPEDLVSKLRASILLVGPILQRFGAVSFKFPGGDIIGKRSIEAHLDGFSKLGAKISQNDLYFTIKKKQLKNDAKIFLSEASVTATENLILASVINNVIVLIRNVSSEPHVIDLCHLLIKMGAKIEGVGTDTLIIKGVKKLKGVKFRIGDDYLEIATYAIAAAITNGDVTIYCDPETDLQPIEAVLEDFGVFLIKQKNGFRVKSDQIKAIDKIITNIWPGFPTDLMSVAIVLSTQAKGVTLCHDWMYESRMFFVDKLISMGAKIIIADPHRVLVYGPTQLRAREVETPDIRAGMALVLAALIASGESIINKAELIERGYEDVVGKLSRLGAEIKKIN